MAAEKHHVASLGRLEWPDTLRKSRVLNHAIQDVYARAESGQETLPLARRCHMLVGRRRRFANCEASDYRLSSGRSRPLGRRAGVWSQPARPARPAVAGAPVGVDRRGTPHAAQRDIELREVRRSERQRAITLLPDYGGPIVTAIRYPTYITLALERRLATPNFQSPTSKESSCSTILVTAGLVLAWALATS